jgi:hypothetical protein
MIHFIPFTMSSCATSDGQSRDFGLNLSAWWNTELSVIIKLDKDLPMGVVLAILMLAMVTSAQVNTTDAAPKPMETKQSASEAVDLSGDLLTMPKGKSTVIGGTISAVDPIADRLTLKVFGGKQMKMLFDERTQVYRDGAKSSLRDLRANDRASVETMLDGDTVFARSIHMLSRSPEGECHGQILSYDPGAGVMTVSESLSPEAIKLVVPAGTTIVRQGQAASRSGAASVSDLRKGTLISATFASDNKGQGVAHHIAILASPGDELSFSGSVTYLNLRSNQFVVADAQNDQSYKIVFDPASLPAAHDLHEGVNVKVTAEFDGSHYIARAIALQ